MGPFLLPAISAMAGRAIGKSGAEDEAHERIELAKELANLTPEQAKAFDAIKTQPIEEVRARVTLKIGPYAPLPPNASERAQQIRDQRIAAGTLTPPKVEAASENVRLTPAEHMKIMNAPDPQAVFDSIADQKASEILANGSMNWIPREGGV